MPPKSSSRLLRPLLPLATACSLALSSATLRGDPPNDLAPDPTPHEPPPIVVTAGRLPQDPAHTPNNQTRFNPEDITASPAITVDDFLRQVPGFSLFRRTSSLVAHPTTQGVSLRGIAPSGTSRSLVLYDGLPMNDPFGGWVYWSRMDLQNVDRIEVVRGGGSTVWGNAALGGVIHLIPRPHQPRSLRSTLSHGNRDTQRASFFASDTSGPWALSLEGRHFTTDGYKRVHPDQRGEVDIESSSQHALLNTALQYHIHQDAHLTLRAGWFDEDRSNGTPLTNNAYQARRISARLQATAPDNSSWDLSTYGERGNAQSTFSAVAEDRNSERLVLDQHHIPSRTLGTGIRNTRSLDDSLLLTLGTDSRWVRGETNERSPFFQRRAGGEQLLTGLFAESTFEPSPLWHLSSGARLDYWRQFDGFSQGFPNDPDQVRRSFPSRDGFVLTPRLGSLFHPASHTTLRSTLYRGFRIPTLNELYRPFQVGADRTFANENLDPERLTGFELGLDHDLGDRLSLSLTSFWNEISDTVANVTIDDKNPMGGRDRQRQNLDRSRILGLESELAYHLNPHSRLFARHALTHAQVRKASNQPALEGNRLAQVPLHVLVTGIELSHPSQGRLSLSLRYNGPQYEDDLNQRQLHGYTVVDLAASRQLHEHAEIFLGVDNLFNRRYPDAITGDGLVTQGVPTFAHLGARLSF